MKMEETSPEEEKSLSSTSEDADLRQEARHLFTTPASTTSYLLSGISYQSVLNLLSKI